MSGPKIIVYNVTPQMEERLRQEVRHRLQQMQGQWQPQRLRLLGCLDQLEQRADGASVKAIQESIALLDRRFTELQDPVSVNQLMRDIYQNRANFDFLTEEIERLRDQVTTVAVQANLREQSMQFAVQDLAARLAASGLTEERDRLLLTPNEKTLQQSSDALNRAQSAERESAFLKALDEFGPRPSTTSLSKPKPDPELERVEQQIVRLELLSQGQEAKELRARFVLLQANTNLRQRRLLLNSLVLEISDVVNRENEAEKLQTILDELEARLGVFAAAPKEFRDEISTLRNKPASSAAAMQLKLRIETWCEQHAHSLDNQYVRNLVLGSLRDSGYDLREGMQTAWVKDGSIVLHKPGNSDYGVELQDLNGNLRSRVVRFGDPGAPVSEQQRQRDSEIEQQWCQAHAFALVALRDKGVDAKIMAKREPGEVPVAVIRVTEDGRPSQAVTDPGKKTIGL